MVIAVDPLARTRVPKRVVSDSAASRNADVGMALSLLASIGTSTNDLCRVSNQVPPVGKEAFAGTAILYR